jgi:hypothetical protein
MRLANRTVGQLKHAISPEPHSGNPVWHHAGNQAKNEVSPSQKNNIYRKFHSDCVNPLARHKPQRFLGTQMLPFEQADQSRKKIISFANFSGKPGVLG